MSQICWEIGSMGVVIRNPWIRESHSVPNGKQHHSILRREPMAVAAEPDTSLREPADGQV
jgi:hypothetical protein